jgi:hypothetical protein
LGVEDGFGARSGPSLLWLRLGRAGGIATSGFSTAPEAAAPSAKTLETRPAGRWQSAAETMVCFGMSIGSSSSAGSGSSSVAGWPLESVCGLFGPAWYCTPCTPCLRRTTRPCFDGVWSIVVTTDEFAMPHSRASDAVPTQTGPP